MAIKIVCDECGKELAGNEVCMLRLDVPTDQAQAELEGRSRMRELCIDCAIKILDNIGAECACPKN